MLMVILIVVVAACLAIGLLVGKMWLVWCALMLSVLGTIVVGVIVLRRRKGAAIDIGASPRSEVSEFTSVTEGYFGAGEASTAEEATNPAKTTAAAEASPRGGAKNAAGADKPEAAPEDTTTEHSSVAAGNCASSESPVSSEAKVLNGDHAVRVVPGGRRFHVAGCRLLEGKVAEEINLEEAQEEGFSACTTCIPRRELLVHAG